MHTSRSRARLVVISLLALGLFGCDGPPRPLPGGSRDEAEPAARLPDRPDGAVEAEPSDLLGEWEAELWRVDYDAPWLRPDEAVRHREFVVSRPEMRLVKNRPIPEEPDKLLVRLTVRGEAITSGTFEITHESPDLDEPHVRKFHGLLERLDDGRLALDAIRDEFVLTRLEDDRLHVAADVKSIGGDLSQRRPFDFAMSRATDDDGDEVAPAPRQDGDSKP